MEHPVASPAIFPVARKSRLFVNPRQLADSTVLRLSGMTNPEFEAMRTGGSTGRARGSEFPALSRLVFIVNLQFRNTAETADRYADLVTPLLTGRVYKGRLRGAPGCPYFLLRTERWKYHPPGKS